MTTYGETVDSHLLLDILDQFRWAGRSAHDSVLQGRQVVLAEVWMVQHVREHCGNTFLKWNFDGITQHKFTQKSKSQITWKQKIKSHHQLKSLSHLESLVNSPQRRIFPTEIWFSPRKLKRRSDFRRIRKRDITAMDKQDNYPASKTKRRSMTHAWSEHLSSDTWHSYR